MQEFNNSPSAQSLVSLKEEPQISTTARVQLFLRAIEGIEDTETKVFKKIDALLTKWDARNEVVVGMCLRRLQLEHRRRVARYRMFEAQCTRNSGNLYIAFEC